MFTAEFAITASAVKCCWYDRGGQTRQQKIMRLLHTFASNPIGVSRALPGLMRQRHGTDQDYEVDEAWEEHLHEMLGAPWPCPQGPRIDELVTSIGALLAGQGLGFGRYTYGIFSDADTSLCRAVWCTVVHTRPEAVIETGVAHGVTSRIVLEALNQNDRGHLWSIDLPYPFDHRLHVQTGAAVTDAAGRAGPTWKAPAGSGFRGWWPTSAASGCSSTTACTRPGTWCSRCSRPGRRWCPAGSCW